MKFKQGVIMEGVSPEMLIASGEIEKIYRRNGLDCTITSCKDGKHKDDSLHYEGNACDFRTRDIPANLVPLIVDQVKRKLGPDFDVILEATHLHVEYDPKG